jgi:serine/threonine protein kinase
VVGQVLSHYKVLEGISRGGMGIVYRAVDTKLDREVALKVLPPELVASTGRTATWTARGRRRRDRNSGNWRSRHESQRD